MVIGMRAAVLFGPGDIRVTERQVPVPGPDEVLVKVAMCGTCGTDLKILDGRFPQTPSFGAFIPGHEWTGTVAATGSGVDEFAAGDRVCIEAHRGCGRLELGRRLGADHVIDAAAADPGPVTFDLSAVVRKDITIHTSRGEGGGNVRRAISLAARGKLRGAEMVTCRFGLDDISEAFRVVRERIGDPVKVVIIP
jgi:threonine dehydrogenase-like Zn-dependent dehydrogenase